MRRAGPRPDGGPPAGNPSPPVYQVPESFDAFYAREYAGLVRLALVLSGSRHAAEDLAQDALLAAYRNWPRLVQPLAWTRRVVANLAASAVRRRLVEVRALTRLAVGRDQVVQELPAEEEEFWAAVRSLPRRQGQMVALYYLEDCSVADIAVTMDCAEGTVRATLHKGRAALARRLRVADQEEP